MDRDFLERLVTRTLVFTGEEIIDLYGGYTDYLTYHKKDIKVEKCIKKKTIKNIPEDTVKSQKLSYKYVRLLESLPIEIDQLEKNIMDIESKLFERDLYVLNNDKFNKLTDSLLKAKEMLDQKITEWLEVEAIKDKLEK